MNKICPTCQCQFTVPNWKKTKIRCSRKCYDKSREEPPLHSENLIVKDRAYVKNRMRYWHVKCLLCQNERIMGDSSLRVSKSCGCQSVGKGKLNMNWKGIEEFSSTYFSEIKKQAKKRNKEFNLTIEYLWNLYIEQNKKCSLCGLDISFGETICVKVKSKNAKRPFRYLMNRINNTVSLDRIDPKKGYIIGNVQWVHKELNFMKLSHTQEYFIKLCNLVSEKHKEN